MTDIFLATGNSCLFVQTVYEKRNRRKSILTNVNTLVQIEGKHDYRVFQLDFDIITFQDSPCRFVIWRVICSFSIVFSFEKCSKILASEATKERLPINIAGMTVLPCVYLFNFFFFPSLFFSEIIFFLI